MGVAIHVLECDRMLSFGFDFVVEVLLNVLNIALIGLINAMLLEIVVLFQTLL